MSSPSLQTSPGETPSKSVVLSIQQCSATQGLNMKHCEMETTIKNIFTKREIRQAADNLKGGNIPGWWLL